MCVARGMDMHILPQTLTSPPKTPPPAPPPSHTFTQLATKAEEASKASSLEVHIAALESKLSDAQAALENNAGAGAEQAEALRQQVHLLEAQQTQLEGALAESTSISEQWKVAYEALDAQRAEAEARAGGLEKQIEEMRGEQARRAEAVAAVDGPIDAERVLELTHKLREAEAGRWVGWVGCEWCVWCGQCALSTTLSIVSVSMYSILISIYTVFFITMHMYTFVDYYVYCMSACTCYSWVLHTHTCIPTHHSADATRQLSSEQHRTHMLESRVQQLEDMVASGIATPLPPSGTAANGAAVAGGAGPHGGGPHGPPPHDAARLAELQQRLAEQGAMVSGLQGENASLRGELDRQRKHVSELESMLLVRCGLTYCCIVECYTVGTVSCCLLCLFLHVHLVPSPQPSPLYVSHSQHSHKHSQHSHKHHHGVQVHSKCHMQA